jgi:hypothetical protein
MARTKKFKTVAGYLRSNENEKLCGVDPDSDAERTIERQIINHMLPQLGITDTIKLDEKPRDGVERLLQQTTEVRQLKALKDCRKWLRRAKGHWTVTSSTAVSRGMIYRGQDFNAEETAAIEQIQSEQKVSIDKAIEIWRSRGGRIVTYRLDGFLRADHKQNVFMFVDAEEFGEPRAIAEKIVGPKYLFPLSGNCVEPIPDAAKNRLFKSDQELYAEFPELNPRQRRRAAR